MCLNKFVTKNPRFLPLILKDELGFFPFHPLGRGKNVKNLSK